MNVAHRLLSLAVRRMPVERREWGEAMLAELAAIREARARWRFALGCSWVAAFPPETGASRPMTKSIFTIAILVGTLLAAPLLYLQIRNGGHQFPYALFALLWVLPAACVMVATPLIQAARAGVSALPHPVTIAVRVAFLIAATLFWAAVVQDQMPCFLGVPNCD